MIKFDSIKVQRVITVQQKYVLTIFLDTKTEDLAYLFESNNNPIIVLNNEQQPEGIIEAQHYWRQIALQKESLPRLEDLFHDSFAVFHDVEEITSNDMNRFKYALIKQNHEYMLYEMKEIMLYKLKKELEGLNHANESLIEQLDEANRTINELKQIINASYDEIYVTDAEGNTLFVSEASKKLTGVPPEAFIGKNVKELTKKGLIPNSATLRAIETKSVAYTEQNYSNGLTVISTAKPIFDEDGNLFRVVTNSRDISELVQMREKLKQMSQNQKPMQEPKYIEHVFYYNGLITASSEMFNIIDLIKKVAKTDSSIFIHGESGVGKGVLARLVHDLSLRNKKQFVHVNSGAIPPSLIESELFGYEAGAFTGASRGGKKGLVELANGGTLFLDEIGEMPLDMQVKLLHLLQEKKFMRVGGTKEINADIRIISATNKDLKKMVSEGRFREDLYYRLHVVPITIPPLRQRKEDISLLLDYFVYKFNEKHKQNITIDQSAKILLQMHDFPGNVRELENLVEQIVVTSLDKNVSITSLPQHFNQLSTLENKKQAPLSLKEAVENTEKQLLKQALKRCKTTRELAKELQVSQTTIMRKLMKYHLSTK